MNMVSDSPLFIDDRVGSRELEEFITSPKQITRLLSADFSFLGNGPTSDDDPYGVVSVGIERKTVGDLIQSMDSGRFTGSQLPKLLNQHQFIYILVEGLWRPRPNDGVLETWRKGKWMPNSTGGRMHMARDLNNYLNTLAIVCGVHVWRTDNPSHSGKWLSDLYRWWHKPWDKHRAHFKQFNVTPPPRAMLRKPTLLHRIVKEFDGIGWDKGKAIADHFGSLIALLSASKKEIMEVPGVGKKLAERLYKELGTIR